MCYFFSKAASLASTVPFLGTVLSWLVGDCLSLVAAAALVVLSIG